MKKSIASALCIFTCLTCFSAFGDETAKLNFSGENAPEASFISSGKSVKLSEFKGKVVLLHFWASWCTPCLKELPVLSKMLQKTGDDVVVIALSNDRTEKAMEQFVASYTAKGDKFFQNKSVRVFWDDDYVITQDLFQTFKLPETVIISPEGKMVKKIIGSHPWDSEETISYLKSLNKSGNVQK